MFVVRSLSTAEQLVVFVEDPAAQSTTTNPSTNKGKHKQTNNDQDDDDDDDMHIIDNSASTQPHAASADPTSPAGRTPPTHSRWSHITLGSTTTGSAVAPFDAFLQRVLLGGSAAANNPAAGAWVPRATAVSLEGWVFSVGGAPGTVGDWEIRVDAVNLKGGAASGASRGLVVEATYLAVPYLPAGSTFVRDFLLSLFPPQAVAAGEVELIAVPDASFVEAGLLPAVVAEDGGGDGEGEWEWTDKHSCFAYVQTFRKEGLL